MKHPYIEGLEKSLKDLDTFERERGCKGILQERAEAASKKWCPQRPSTNTGFDINSLCGPMVLVSYKRKNLYLVSYPDWAHPTLKCKEFKVWAYTEDEARNVIHYLYSSGIWFHNSDQYGLTIDSNFYNLDQDPPELTVKLLDHNVWGKLPEDPEEYKQVVERLKNKGL